MKKELALSFISKFFLNEINDIIHIDNNLLTSTVITKDESLSVVTKVESKTPIFSTVGSYGLYDNIKQLSNFISLFSEEDISDEAIKSNGILSVLKLKNSKEKLNIDFYLSDLTLIGARYKTRKIGEPKKLPDTWEINVDIDFDFVSKLLKGMGAMKDTSVLSLVPLENELSIVIGTPNSNEHKISMNIKGTVETFDGHLPFVLRYWKEILSANKDMDRIKIKASSKGMAEISCENKNFSCKYWTAIIKE